MKRYILIGLIGLLSGCATFEQVATSETTFHVCRAADVLTSWEAFRLGATETGPLPQNILIIGLVSLAFSWIAHEGWDKADTAGKVIMNTASCLPPAGNIGVIRDLKH